MALSKTTKVDKIEIIGDYKHVQVRTATRVLEDGVVLSSSFSRHVVAPDADISGETQEVQDVCNAVHTQAVKDAYAAHLAEQAAEMGGE
jgi:hypothetical protein